MTLAFSPAAVCRRGYCLNINLLHMIIFPFSIDYPVNKMYNGTHRHLLYNIASDLINYESFGRNGHVI